MENTIKVGGRYTYYPRRGKPGSEVEVTGIDRDEFHGAIVRFRYLKNHAVREVTIGRFYIQAPSPENYNPHPGPRAGRWSTSAMRVPLWALESAIKDAVEALEWASELAGEAAGAAAGREPVPAFDVPGIEPRTVWPAMLTLCDRLAELAGQVKAAVPDEVRAAMKDEAEELDA
jgi:hypothetical protein